MKYLTFEQYREYGGQIEEEDEFNSLLDISQQIIDINTFNKLVRLEEIPEHLAPFISKATFYQLEYLYNTGGIDSILGMDSIGNIKSESLGKYSVSFETENNSSYRIGGVTLNTMAANELDKVYLRNRWIGRC